MCLTFLPFSIFNIYSNYRSSYYVTTPSLNIPRAETVFNVVLNGLVLEKEGRSQEKSAATDLLQQLERLIPTPKDVAHNEVFVRSYESPFRIGLNIEPTLARFAGKDNGTAALDRAFRQLDFVQKEQYYIMVDGSIAGRKRAGLCNGKVVIWFDKKAKSQDLIRGFYHACAARAILERSRNDGSLTASENEWDRAVAAAHEQTIETVPKLVEVMDRKGWDTTSLFLTDGDRNRIQIE